MKITFDSLQEIRDFMDEITFPAVPKEDSKPETKKNDGFVPAPKEEVPFEEDPKTYTLVEVRAELSKLTKTGKKEQVHKLLQEFGAEKLTQVKEEDYPALMKKAGEL